MNALKKLEWPKMIYGPNGEEVVVQDAADQDEQMRAWYPPQQTEISAPVSVSEMKRGPGRPKKVA